MADELAIGDMEDAINAMRIQLDQSESQEEKDVVFQSILLVQSELNQLRTTHGKTN